MSLVTCLSESGLEGTFYVTHRDGNTQLVGGYVALEFQEDDERQRGVQQALAADDEALITDLMMRDVVVTGAYPSLKEYEAARAGRCGRFIISEAA